ncbi:MAG: TIGR04255 family protein [Sedimentisphaerales bacterium]|nr:TIGR04255 family protein [Sedimentisphaerales bacterium]
MAIKEVFPNPTVKQVIFQIRFPNLFSMERLIGDYQVKIMAEFPKSALLVRRSVLIADVGSRAQVENIAEDADKFAVSKIWNFRSEKGIDLNVHNDSLDISSTLHKTYANPKEDNRFRDTIEYAVARFLEVTQIPKLARIGLRYIDECPVPAKETQVFKEYYNTTFPLKRFPVENALNLVFEARVEKGDRRLRFIESFEDVGGKLRLTLDFDGYAEDVPAHEYLTVTDELHELISKEYQASIRKPVLEHMRKKEKRYDRS